MPKTVVIAAMLLGLFTWGVVSLIQESVSQWEAFKREHDCKVVANVGSEISYGISSSGKVVSMIQPSKTGWLCNDGVTYYR